MRKDMNRVERNNMKLSQLLEVCQVETDMIWAAAAYGHRMNKGEYIKHDSPAYKDTWTEKEMPARISNKSYAFDSLEDPTLLTQEDYQFGADMKAHFRGLTFKALSSKINDFEKNVIVTTEVEDWNTDSQANYHFAILMSLPKVYARVIEREDIDDEIRRIKSTHFGQVKDRIDTTIRVLRSIYSKNYNTYFVTAVKDEKNIVFFAFKDSLPRNNTYHIRGTLKAHRDAGQTQLNRVKIVDA